MFLIFLSCLEKAYDNKEFSRGNSKPRRESWIITHYVEPWFMYNFNIRLISDFLLNWNVLLIPAIYCCFCNFCLISVGKIVNVEVVVVTIEILVLRKKRFKRFTKKVKSKTTDERVTIVDWKPVKTNVIHVKDRVATQFWILNSRSFPDF